MADTLKIPRAAIQYTNQDLQKDDNVSKMRKILVKSTTVDSLPNEGNNFEAFSNDLKRTESIDKSPRHSTFSGKDLTTANLARLNKLHKNAPNETVPTNREFTITVDSMTTTQNHKPKENDVESNASSTHFTVVNGFGGTRLRQPTKPACCCNLITAVIVSMTILFMIIIFGVIIFAEYPRMMAEIE
ncbi:uncharacterized protein LOC119080791 isoform X2 [Bradysia coprophila]|nr:uncharacterized protein LOC119080791 isoform X2 [Bradysia coprophila]